MKMADRPHKVKRILPIIMLLVFGLLIYKFLTRNAQDENIITASGTIEATEIDISARVGGRIITLNVDEGDSVKKGEIIAVLDAKELNARVIQATGALLAAESKLADLLKGTRDERIRSAAANYRKAVTGAQGAQDVYSTLSESYNKSTELKANMDAAQANLKASDKQREAAFAALTMVKKGPRQEEIDLLKANVNQVSAQLASAESDYSRYAKLFAEGAISQQQLDNSTALRDSLRANLEAAQAKYNQALAGSRSEEIDAARAKLAEADARVEGAKKTLASAKEAYTDRLESLQRLQNAKTTADSSQAQVTAAKAELDLLLAGPTSDEIKMAMGQVEQANGALAEAKSHLTDATITAPADGVVTVKSREVGEIVNAGTPIVRIADTRKVWLRVFTPLPNLGRIKVGQDANVTTDTYKDKVYRGTVASIKEDPEFTPKNIQTAEERVKFVYAVRINIDNIAQELKPGMPADAKIDTRATADRTR